MYISYCIQYPSDICNDIGYDICNDNIQTKQIIIATKTCNLLPTHGMYNTLRTVITFIFFMI